jgi:hypothetical protein
MLHGVLKLQFAHAIKELSGANVKIAKRSEHTFAVRSQRWVVE